MPACSMRKASSSTDLKPEDFEVFEDGKPQKVTAFSLVNIPVERAERPLFASKPIEPDVRNNLQGADGRIYLIVLDDLHTTALRSQRTKLAAQHVHRALRRRQRSRRGGPHRRPQRCQPGLHQQPAAAAAGGRQVHGPQAALVDAEQDRRRATGAPARPLASDPARDLDDKERGFQARNTLDTIRNLAQYLGNIRGRRKAIVMFSEGIDYNIYDIMSINNSGATEASTVMDATRDMLAAATRANVAIYGVDPRGLGAAFDDLAEIQSFPDDTSPRPQQSALFNEVRLGARQPADDER